MVLFLKQKLFFQNVFFFLNFLDYGRIFWYQINHVNSNYFSYGERTVK